MGLGIANERYFAIRVLAVSLLYCITMLYLFLLFNFLNEDFTFFCLYRAEDLPHVLYRVGLLAVLRSKSKRGKDPINIQMYILFY
jgi:hypothetical protein